MFFSGVFSFRLQTRGLVRFLFQSGRGHHIPAPTGHNLKVSGWALVLLAVVLLALVLLAGLFCSWFRSVSVGSNSERKKGTDPITGSHFLIGIPFTRCSGTLDLCIRSIASAGHMVVCVVTVQMVGDRRLPGATILGVEVVYFLRQPSGFSPADRSRTF